MNPKMLLNKLKGGKNDFIITREEKTMTSDENQFFGLCSTCNHASTCKHSRNSNNPVWHCEEFDDYSPLAVTNNSHYTHSSSDTGEKYSEKFKGLCMNCDNRNTCSKSQTEGGVWHCEEYR